MDEECLIRVKGRVESHLGLLDDLREEALLFFLRLFLLLIFQIIQKVEDGQKIFVAGSLRFLRGDWERRDLLTGNYKYLVGILKRRELVKDLEKGHLLFP